MSENQYSNHPLTVDAHHYLKLEIDKQAADKVDEFIRLKSKLFLKIGKFLLLPLILIMTGVPIWQATSINKLKEKIEIANKIIDTAKNNLIEVETLTKKATKSVIDSSKTTLLVANSVTGTTKQIINLQNKHIKAQESIALLQQELNKTVNEQVTQAEKQKKAADDVYMKTQNKFSEIEQRINQMNTLSTIISSQAKKINSQAKEVDEIHQNILGQEGDLQNLIKLNEEIINLKAADTVWIRQNRESGLIKLPNIAKPGSAAYFIKLKIGDIKRETLLEYKLKLPNKTNWIPENTGWTELYTIKDNPSKNKQIHQPLILIPDTPYEVKVMFINHSFRGRDFVALRIQPRS